MAIPQPLGYDAGLVSLRGNPAYLSSVSRDVLGEAQLAHRDGRLGFLVGAGLSVPIGLPGWNSFNYALVREVLERHESPQRRQEHKLATAYLEQLQGQSLAAAEFARRRAGDDFHIATCRRRYTTAPSWPAMPGPTPNPLRAFAQLAVESKPPFPCLHTTNYDDLLERALTRVAGKPARAIHLDHRLTTDGPRVVHLHGYFPFDAPQKQRARLARDLVLSDLDFSRLSNDHSAWTNRELLALLDARAVLILGMSLTDPNVRRLLAYLSDRNRTDGTAHYVVLLHRSTNSPGVVNDSLDEAAQLLDTDEYDVLARPGRQDPAHPGHLGSSEATSCAAFASATPTGIVATTSCASPWAKEHYGPLDVDDEQLQTAGTAGASARARDALVASRGAARPRRAQPLFAASRRQLPAACCRRWREKRHRGDRVPSRAVAAIRVTIPEIEAGAHRQGQDHLSRHELGATPPPPAQPPFQSWYQSLVSVPTFDDARGGVPVAVIQLVSSEPKLSEGLDAARLTRMSRMLREVVDISTQLFGSMSKPAT